MKKVILFIFSIASLNVFAQKKYFQQQADFNIDVTLDDENHILRGFEKINYTNHSTDTLNYIIFHLWPNAFKDDKSTYTEHEVANGDTKFYYSKEIERGFIDSLTFVVNEKKLNISNYNNLEDVILVELDKPLLPKQTIDIETPFRIVLPIVFSRLGHTQQAYQITQWYPKPAVYDALGWHPLPYLDQGEFYNDYGNYKVSITLPKNYVVATSGNLQNEEEKKWLQQLKNDTSKRETKSSSQFKTLTYTQNNIHDFAWFANKEFLIEDTMAVLENGRKIKCVSFFKPENKKIYTGSSKITAFTIKYLSTHVGEYPYNEVAVVDGTLLAGGGMEYPAITVIGKVHAKGELQTVIIHEVGHNWFQGIIGNNERDHAWMDEGINTFYEKKIDDALKANHQTDIDKIVAKIGENFIGNFVYLLSASQHEDQSLETTSSEFTKLNYGACVYNKTAAMLNYLESYMGKEEFEKAMKNYFETWKHKHPYPNDFEKIMKQATTKNINWFFEDGLKTNHKIDYAIKNVNHNTNFVTVKNRNKFKGPISISALQKDSIIETQWIDYPYTKGASFSSNNKKNKYKINANHSIPEINFTNNTKGFNLRPNIGTGFSLSEKNKIFVIPAIGYNFYDKVMLGVAFHNLKIPNNRFQYAIMPMLSLASKQIVGSYALGYTVFPANRFHKITFSLQGNSYHHESTHMNINKTLFVRHIKASPSILIELKKPTPRSTITNEILLQTNFIANQLLKYNYSVIDSLYRPALNGFGKNIYHVVQFAHKNNRTLNPYSYQIKSEGNNQYLKLAITGNLKINYHLPNKALYIRSFAGKFFNLNSVTSSVFSLQNQWLATTSTSANDYYYNQVYLARNEQKGFLSHQIAEQEGFFKTRTSLLSSPVGVNNNWLAAVNIKTDFPIKSKIKLQLFIDAATYANAGKLNASGSKAIYEAGLELHLFKNLIGIYAPFILSKDLKTYVNSTYTKNKIVQNMSFSFNLNQLNVLQSHRLLEMVMP